jgi:hypothetical protein
MFSSVQKLATIASARAAFESVDRHGDREPVNPGRSSWLESAIHVRRSTSVARQIVMDATGDTRHEFDAADIIGLTEAEERFRQLTGAGFTAAVRQGDGQARLVRSFDPAAEETVFIPRLQGG